MKLDKENMRKMRQLILFTIIILIALWNYKMIFDAIRFVFGIIFPFLLGGGIAFVLNVPMSFFEEKLFYNRYLKDKKIANRIARPISLVLTIAVLIGVVVLVMFVVIPELTKTVISLGKTIQTDQDSHFTGEDDPDIYSRSPALPGGTVHGQQRGAGMAGRAEPGS